MIGKEKGKRKDKLRKKGGLPSPEVTAPRTVSGGTQDNTGSYHLPVKIGGEGQKEKKNGAAGPRNQCVRELHLTIKKNVPR